ncbi:MAG TPA: ABC transporter permease [Candidatus Acidoferrales bacterium]
METLRQDIAYGIRMLIKSPALTVIAVLTLALGIGANTAIFSVVNTFLLQPLPVPGGEDIVVLAVTHETNPTPHGISLLDWREYRAQETPFTDIAGYQLGFVGLADQGRADRVAVTYVTGNYFSLLKLEPAQGRLFRPGEGEQPGGELTVVLSYAYWQRRFGGDPDVVGSAVRINGRGATIIGVSPQGFHGAYFIASTQIFMPISATAAGFDPDDAALWTNRNSHTMKGLARLKPGATRAEAQSAMNVIVERMARQYAETDKGLAMQVLPERLARPEAQSGSQVPVVAAIFMGLAGLVLLVACVNVANLLLARASTRQKEFAVRVALGAGRIRLVRQLLTESVILALAGGAAGALMGWWTKNLLASIRLPGDMPLHFAFDFDWRVFGVVAAFALGAGIIAGVAPALRAARADVQDALREGGRALAGGAGHHRVRNTLVVAQVAGSLVLLVAAGLFVRSLMMVERMDLGFNPEGVLNLSIDPAQQGYDEARARAFFRDLKEGVRALPGVAAASLAYSVPMGYYSTGDSIRREGHASAPGETLPSAGFNIVGHSYFETMRVPLLRGRGFTNEDTADSRRVAVVNTRFAEQFWPGEDPIGKRFQMGSDQRWVEVVGLTTTGKYQWSMEDPRAYFFVPREQYYRSVAALHVRAAEGVAPESLTASVREQIHALDADLPIYDVSTMQRALYGGNGFFLHQMGAAFAGALGLLGLALAVVGVYGVVSYAVSQRTHEIGIRMALGAQHVDILKMILRQGLVLVLIGLGLGVAAAFGAAQLLSNLLYGVAPSDPATFAAVSALLISVALVACWVPARRATRVDPMIALRYE